MAFLDSAARTDPLVGGIHQPRQRFIANDVLRDPDTRACDYGFHFSGGWRVAGSGWGDLPATRHPLPAESCVRPRVERKEIVAGEPVFAPAELTNDLRAALIDHFAQLVGREKRQRRQRALAAAR